MLLNQSQFMFMNFSGWKNFNGKPNEKTKAMIFMFAVDKNFFFKLLASEKWLSILQVKNDYYQKFLLTFNIVQD